jgi:hypothetical protein
MISLSFWIHEILLALQRVDEAKECMQNDIATTTINRLSTPDVPSLTSFMCLVQEAEFDPNFELCSLPHFIERH